GITVPSAHVEPARLLPGMQSEAAGGKEEGKYKATEKEATIRRFVPVRASFREAIQRVCGAIGSDNVLVHNGAEGAVSTLLNDLPSPGD
ncbi:MAG: hypothetical protein V3T03_04410, partial [Candidatus Bipolaricaulota bacterium]